MQKKRKKKKKYKRWRAEKTVPEWGSNIEVGERKLSLGERSGRFNPGETRARQGPCRSLQGNSIKEKERKLEQYRERV